MLPWRVVSSWPRSPPDPTSRLYYSARLALAKPCLPRPSIIHQREQIGLSSHLTHRRLATHCSRVSYLVTNAEHSPGHNKPLKESLNSPMKARFFLMKSRR